MSCCLAVRRSDGAAAVLKLAVPWTPAAPEAKALTVWDGAGAPSLLRTDSEGGALLLERIEPGTTFDGGDDPPHAGRVAELVRELHAPQSSSAAGEFPELADV